MESYPAYTQNDQAIPLDGHKFPDDRHAIITILDESPVLESRLERQKKALMALEKGLAECLEPLPPEFDEILAEKINITGNIYL